MIDRPDAVVLFNAGNAPFLRVLTRRHIPVAMHVDGLEWKRAKWQGLGARYYRHAEAIAARSGVALIADAQGISDYLRETYDASNYVIAYGAPILYPGADRLGDLDLRPDEYHLVVARMEPENHVDVIVEGYASWLAEAARRRRLGSVRRRLHRAGQVTRRQRGCQVRRVGLDQDLLNQLYAHATSYLHGHSVGGTNPSLLRALGCAAPVTAFDVSFNREVTDGHARFFTTAADVATAVAADDADPDSAHGRAKAGQEHVALTYRWDDVTDRYEAMLEEIVRAQ